jgi:aryl-alcohol dehydrogenase-like predicted oxidoreductase
MLRRLFSVAGRATSQGTEAYRGRNAKVAESSWRQTSTGLTLSSVGLGTYIGAPDDETDALVTSAVISSVTSGVLNHIDTAINYRYQKAERSVGRALTQLIAQGYQRSELFVSTKIGYIPEDADKGVPGKSIINELKKKQLITDDDVVGGVHSMHPEFLKDQLARSLDNLQLETIDLLYLHNTAEAQMPMIGEEKYLKRLASAFEFCETQRQSGKIANYGLASWICFRSPASEKEIHLSLNKVVRLAEEVGGAEHGMRFVQLPVNIMMPEAFIHKWQELKGNDVIFLNAAKDLGINVITSSPLLQGKIVDLKLSKTMIGIDLQACKHLQMIRSIPSSAIKCVLVGMKNPRNVMQNLQLPYVESLTAEEFWNVLKPEGRESMAVTIDLW